ncbi:MAG: hypothetical protein HZA01_13525 [Nitrospinae bacterium]|nr:hypothetical protein [Nitrospinota bacterium]
MPATIPVDVYEEFEKGLGNESARKVVKGLEAVISDFTEYKWKVTKDELLGAIRKEFVTRELFEERMNTLKVELEGKIEQSRTELEGKIDKLNQKFNFMIILMIIALTLMNPVMAEVIKGFLK